jgi:hypothetical protein
MWQLEVPDARVIRRVRVVVACIALLKAATLAPLFVELAEPGALRLPMIASLPPLPASVFPAVLILWVLAALAFLAGWKTRISGRLLLLTITCVLLGDQQLYSNHLYLLATMVLLILLTEGDAGARGGDTRPESAPNRWPFLLLKLQVTIVYGYSALAKINDTFLSGAVLNQYMGDGAIVPFPDGARSFAVLSAVAVLTIAVELWLASAIWSERLARPTILTGVAFHLGIVLLFARSSDLAIFGMGMFALYFLFLPSAGKDAARLAAATVTPARLA